MGTERKAKVLRPLGQMDVYHSSLHLMRMMHTNTVTCSYRIPENLINPDLFDALRTAFYRSLALTVLEHPLLQVGILKEDSKKPSFIELSSIYIGQQATWEIVGFSKDYNSRLHEALSLQAHRFFDDTETKPGWRLHILQEQPDSRCLDVILAWNHSHFDGMSAKMFHETLLRHLNSPKPDDLPNLHGTVLQLESVAPRFPPLVEKVHRLPLTLKYAVSTLWRELKPACFVSGSARRAHWCPIKEDTMVRRSITIPIDATRLKPILKKCRVHGTTLSGLLHALLATSLALQLQKREGFTQDVQSFHSRSAINVRRFLPSKTKELPWYDPKITMSNYLTICGHSFDKETLEQLRQKTREAPPEKESIETLMDLVWSIASRVRQDIQERLDGNLRNDILGLLKYAGDWRSGHKKKFKKPRPGAWMVSNLGVIDGMENRKEDDGTGWSIEKATFQLATDQTSPLFNVAVISVKGKELVVDVMWQEGVIDEQIAIKLSKNIENWLNHLGEEGGEE